MTFFSLDPCFDFTIYAMQVHSYIHPYLSSIQAFRSRQKEGKSLMPYCGSKNTTYTEWFESTTKGEGKLCFVFKNLKLFLQLTWLKEDGDLFQASHSSIAQSFMVDTLNPAVHTWLGMVLCWCLLLRLCLK